jgi:hypothetical protein
MTVYPFVGADNHDGRRIEALLAGNIITSTSLFGAHIIDTRHLKPPDTALSLANTHFRTIYDAPLLAFSLWLILYAVKYRNRMHNL